MSFNLWNILLSYDIEIRNFGSKIGLRNDKLFDLINETSLKVQTLYNKATLIDLSYREKLEDELLDICESLATSVVLLYKYEYKKEEYLDWVNEQNINIKEYLLNIYNSVSDDKYDYKHSDLIAKLNSNYINEYGIFEKPVDLKECDEIRNYSENLAAVKLYDKFGYMDKNNMLIIKNRFDKVHDFAGGLAIVGIDGKFGVIDNNGQIKLPIRYKEIDKPSKSIFEIIDNENLKYITDKNFELFYKVLSVNTSENKFLCMLNGEYFVIDREFKIYKTDFDLVGDFVKGIAIAKKNDKFAYINTIGKLLTDFEFDNIEPFKNNLAFVVKGDSEFLINNDFKIQYSLKRTNIKGTVIIVNINSNKTNAYGLVNLKDNTILIKDLDSISDFSNRYAMINKLNELKLVDISGNICYSVKLDMKEYYIVESTKNKLIGVKDKDFSNLIACKYDDIQPFNNGITQVTKGDKKYYINKTDVKLYDKIYECLEGMSIIEKEGKYGFANEYGQVVIEPIYEKVGKFKNGVVKAYKDNVKYKIDKSGKILKVGGFF
jgi:hypothetical protein